MSNAVLLNGVTKRFGSRTALNDFTLAIPQGHIYGLIGPNGAGKTTALRIIMSILLPDFGTVAVLGRPSALQAKDRIGYLPEERGIYRKMRAATFLSYMGHLKGVEKSSLAKRVRRRLDSLGLEEYATKHCDELSKGTQQKIQFLGAVVHDPDLLILDEPFSGLDPVSTQQLSQLIRTERERGASIIFSTHVMSHAEDLCDHIVMSNYGRKVLDESIAGLRGEFIPRLIRVQPLDPNLEPRSFGTVPGINRIERCATGFELTLMPEIDPATALARVAAAIPSSRIELARRSLEEVFIRLASGVTHP